MLKNELADFLSGVKLMQKDIEESGRKVDAALRHIDSLRDFDQELRLADERLKTIIEERINAIKEQLNKEIATQAQRITELEKEVIKRVTIATTIITILTIAIPLILKFL